MINVVMYIMIALLAVALFVLILTLIIKGKSNKSNSDVRGGGAGIDTANNMFAENRDWTSKRGVHTGTITAENFPRVKIGIINLSSGEETIKYVIKILIIGRNPSADINDPNVYFVKSDNMVSSEHCRIINMGGTAVLEDAGSKNGTFINGQLLNGQVFIQNGDIIKTGNTSLKINLYGDDRNGR